MTIGNNNKFIKTKVPYLKSDVKDQWYEIDFYQATQDKTTKYHISMSYVEENRYFDSNNIQSINQSITKFTN